MRAERLGVSLAMSGFAIGHLRGGDREMHQTHLARRVHGRDHRLVRRLGVGADDQRRFLVDADHIYERALEALDLAIHHALAVDVKFTGGIDGDRDGVLLHFLLLGGGFRQIDVDAGLLVERGRQQKEQQQQKHHVDERDEIHLGVGGAAAAQIHAALPSTTCRSRSPCSISTILSASCSIDATSSSMRRWKWRKNNRLGIATINPAAGVTSASDRPPASSLGLPMPTVLATDITLIMPSTVPSKPSSGAAAAMVPRVLR